MKPIGRLHERDDVLSWQLSYHSPLVEPTARVTRHWVPDLENHRLNMTGELRVSRFIGLRWQEPLLHSISGSLCARLEI